MIIGIVACSKNYAIGRNGVMPWHYPNDLRFFKEKTKGNVVVMGANTWRSIGRELPNRENIVLSNKNGFSTPKSVIRCESIEDVVRYSNSTEKDVFIIGGAETYGSFKDFIEEWFVTFIPEIIDDADTFMRTDFLDDFSETESIALGEGLRATRFVRNI